MMHKSIDNGGLKIKCRLYSLVSNDIAPGTDVEPVLSQLGRL